MDLQTVREITGGARVGTDASAQADFTRRSRRAFDPIALKLRCPPAAPGSVRRASLIERLAREESRPVVSLVAPPGYGKTTLLSQWSGQSERPFAWVSVDERDNNPGILLMDIARALDAIEPIDERVFDLLAVPATAASGGVLDALNSALESMTSPVVLVLDGVHALFAPECRAVVSVLADRVRGGSRLALASRSQPPVRVAPLRAAGRIIELGPKDLALSHGESASVLREAGISVGEDEVAELHRRTEGWPAGLYLATLYLREEGGAGTAVASFGGDDRLVSEYVESEFLARVSGRQRDFLTRTSVLERLCAPLCEAVLGRPGSADALAEVVQSNILLTPLDDRCEWYRYHHLFRDMLLADLERLDPDLMPVLRRRAAQWCLRNGLREEALEYFIAAGDVDAAACLVESLGVQACRQGRSVPVWRWLRWLEDRDEIENRPMVTLLAALVSALTGRPARAERWAAAADRQRNGNQARRGDPADEAWAGVVRAVLCRRGAERMRADADEAARRFATMGAKAPEPALWQGIAHVLTGDLNGGDAFLATAASIARQASAPRLLVTALCERSLLAMARGEWNRAEALVRQAGTELAPAAIDGTFVMPLACAVQARAAVHRGDVPVARRKLRDAARLRPELTQALPYLAVQVGIELIRVRIALGDLAAAHELMRDVDKLLSRLDGMGTLAGQAAELRARLSADPGSVARGAPALSRAELRLLPALATHLSFPEIAEEVLLSRHTVKSEAISIYRKLGVGSRSQAVARARDLGLLHERG